MTARIAGTIAAAAAMAAMTAALIAMRRFDRAIVLASEAAAAAVAAKLAERDRAYLIIESRELRLPLHRKFQAIFQKRAPSHG
jgi:hypothetical protein